MPITKELINKIINVLQFVIVILLTFTCIAFLVININTSNNVKKLSDENTNLERRIMTLESLIMTGTISLPPPLDIDHDPSRQDQQHDPKNNSVTPPFVQPNNKTEQIIKPKS